MSEEPQRENQEVEEQTPQDIPESEVQEQEAGQPQEPEQQPSETETDASQEETNEAEEVPKDNAAWAKMRTENKQLKQALEQSGVDAEYLEMLRQANQPFTPQPSQPQQVNEDAEYNQVTSAVNNAQQVSTQAMQRIQQLESRLEQQQDKSARDKYPDLFRNPEFEAEVAEKKLVARVMGIDRSTTEIADQVAKRFKRSIEQAKVEATQQAQHREAQKTQAVVQPQTTTSSGVSSQDTKDELRERARRGDRQAQETLAKDIIADLDF